MATTNQAMTNNEMREITGFVKGDKLDGFIYTLLRDHITPGKMEAIVMDCEQGGNSEVVFTNGYLAQYAKMIKERLIKIT